MLGALYDGGLSMVNSAIESLGDWVIERLQNQLPHNLEGLGSLGFQSTMTQSLNRSISDNHSVAQATFDMVPAEPLT